MESLGYSAETNASANSVLRKVLSCNWMEQNQLYIRIYRSDLSWSPVDNLDLRKFARGVGLQGIRSYAF